jgi:apolipoprotein N-acyltransferase
MMGFYGNFLPGFPWVLPGYIWCCHEIFLQTLSIYGIYGLSFVTLCISGYSGLSFLLYKNGNFNKSTIYAIVAVLIFLIMTLFGYIRLANNPTRFTDKKIKIVQANISQKNKNNHNYAFLNLKKHLELSRCNSQADFVIWPEASVPYLYREDRTQLHDYLKSILNVGECLIAGAVRQDLLSEKIHNSAVVIDHTGKNIAIFDKRRLLPFGEYIPFRKYIPFQSIAADIDDFAPGTKSNVIEVNGVKIGLAICYEIVFSNAFVSEEKKEPADMIVNITNDGWFGFTTEPFQHLQISRARAIENGMPLLRSTNYGISAVFDSCGREIARIPINEAGIIETSVPRKTNTVFNKYFLTFI